MPYGSARGPGHGGLPGTYPCTVLYPLSPFIMSHQGMTIAWDCLATDLKRRVLHRLHDYRACIIERSLSYAQPSQPRPARGAVNSPSWAVRRISVLPRVGPPDSRGRERTPARYGAPHRVRAPNDEHKAKRRSASAKGPRASRKRTTRNSCDLAYPPA